MGRRKYLVNHRFFSEIEAPTQAYWLGVLWADGNVRRQRVPRGVSHIIKLEIQKRDEDWLHTLIDDLDATYPIFETRCGKAVCLRISSTRMFNDLGALGVVPNKTYLNIIPSIPPNMVSHFVRGVFDGDGCITGTIKRPLIRIVGTEALCEWLLNTTQAILAVGGGVYPKTDIAYTWALCGAKQGNVFAEWIYHDADRYLLRKHTKAMGLGLL